MPWIELARRNEFEIAINHNDNVNPGPAIVIEEEARKGRKTCKLATPNLVWRLLAPPWNGGGFHLLIFVFQRLQVETLVSRRRRFRLPARLANAPCAMGRKTAKFLHCKVL